jgi:tetratricopeptide (TPR) repeat protein
VEHSETAQKSIQSLKIIADQDSRPEARSVRFARLADAYLKAGEIDLALETYRKAIHYTEFRRKQSNFMVKMAMVLHNDGRNDEALQVLEGALELDPQDAAGALEIKNQILAQKS